MTRDSTHDPDEGRSRDWAIWLVAVEGGEIGLDLLRHARSSLGIGIDLVVLDFQMPGMSGAEVAQEIRSDPLIASTPILILSSVDQADQLRALTDLEIFAQLTKPVRTAQLRKTVQSALNQPHTGNGPSAEAKAAGPPGWLRNQAAMNAAPEPGPGRSKPAEARHVRLSWSAPSLWWLVAEDNQIQTRSCDCSSRLDGYGL